MENLGFMILRISILMVFIVLGSLIYEWAKDKMQKNNLTFKDLIFKSAYGLYIVILSCITIPMALFIIYAMFISPILAIFGMM
jgi:hypothetical protein